MHFHPSLLKVWSIHTGGMEGVGTELFERMLSGIWRPGKREGVYSCESPAASGGLERHYWDRYPGTGRIIMRPVAGPDIGE